MMRKRNFLRRMAIVAALATVLVGFGLATDAFADSRYSGHRSGHYGHHGHGRYYGHRGHHGHFGHRHHGSTFFLGFNFGRPYYGRPYYYYPRPYYYGYPYSYYPGPYYGYPY